MRDALERQVRQRAKDQCECCRIPAHISEITFPIDHIVSQQLDPGANPRERFELTRDEIQAAVHGR
jgi:hypothetical protein